MEKELNSISEQKKDSLDKLIEFNQKLYDLEFHNKENKENVCNVYSELIKSNNDLKLKEKRIKNIIIDIATFNKDVEKIFLDKFYSEEEKIWKISNFIYKLYTEEQKL